jgi:hypothetical protein
VRTPADFTWTVFNFFFRFRSLITSPSLLEPAIETAPLSPALAAFIAGTIDGGRKGGFCPARAGDPAAMPFEIGKAAARRALP